MLATLPIPTNARIGYPILQRSGQAGRISCGILRMRKYANLFFYVRGSGQIRIFGSLCKPTQNDARI